MEPDVNEIMNDYTRRYREFISSYQFTPRIIRCLFINAFNHFLAARILADNGLIPQTNNCLRMGLESEWIGIILAKNRELCLNWAFGLGDEKIRETLIDLERPYAIRKTLGDTNRIKIKDRDDIYKALSDKSHTKLSSVAGMYISPGASPSAQFVDCIPLGGMTGENNKIRIRMAVKTVLYFAIADIEECLGYSILEKGWIWNRNDIYHISEGGHENEQGRFEPFITSKDRPGQHPLQAAALLSAIRHGEI